MPAQGMIRKRELEAFAGRCGITLQATRELRNCAIKVRKHAVNGNEAEEARAAETFEILASLFGFTFIWAGLWPVLTKNGIDYSLPE